MLVPHEVLRLSIYVVFCLALVTSVALLPSLKVIVLA